MIHNEEWRKYFFSICDAVAQKSKDTSTKVGAVIVGPDKEIRSVGYNGFPRGVIDDIYDTRIVSKIKSANLNKQIEFIENRNKRPLKYLYMEHAERNAIYNAAREGTHVKGCTIYVNSLPPCCDCARAIIQSGIIKLYYIDKEIPERWKENCEIALDMLEEAGVIVVKVEL